MDGEKASALSTQKGEENGMLRGHPPCAVPQTQPVCHFYSQGRHCHFGRRCRFLHQRGEGVNLAQSTQEKKPVTGAAEGGQTAGQELVELLVASDTQELSRQETCQPSPAPRPSQPPRRERAAGGRPCRYFLSGYCAMEERCRFVHPQQFPPIGEPPRPVAGGAANSTRARAPFARPHQGQQEVKLSELTDEVAKQLRTTEIQQLTKRFPKDRLIVQEREDGKVTYYRVTVQPTDPDWVKFMHLVFMHGSYTCFKGLR